MAKSIRKWRIERHYTMDKVIMHFIDKKSGKKLAQRTWNINKLPESIQKHLLIYGLNKKQGDALAGEMDLDKAIEKQETAFANMVSGQWNVRSAGDSKAPKMTILEEAILRVREAAGTPTTLDKVQKVLLDKETKKACRQDPAISKMYTKVKNERAKARNAKAAETAKAVDMSIFDK